MDKHEYERARPMLWAMFANGSLSRGTQPKNAANEADEMLKHFEARFPVAEDKDDD